MTTLALRVGPTGAESACPRNYSFRVRPRLLAKFLEPPLSRMLAQEVRACLAALREFVERNAIDG